MRLKTDVDISDGKWSITHTYDEGEVLRDNLEARNSGRDGDVENGKAKCIAQIPRHRFVTDFELQMYQKYQGVDNLEAESWMRKWLFKNPEYRTTTGAKKKFYGKYFE